MPKSKIKENDTRKGVHFFYQHLQNFSELDVMDIKKRANALVRKYKTRCPYTIAAMENIKILRFNEDELPNGVMGMATRTLKRRYIILSVNNNEQVDRFVCSHELGHHRLHPTESYQFITNTLFVNDKFELQANKFALELLLDPTTLELGRTKKEIAMLNNLPVDIVEKLL